jgi:hypothetical protein
MSLTYALRETATRRTVASTCGDAFSDTVRTVLTGLVDCISPHEPPHAKIMSTSNEVGHGYRGSGGRGASTVLQHSRARQQQGGAMSSTSLLSVSVGLTDRINATLRVR